MSHDIPASVVEETVEQRNARFFRAMAAPPWELVEDEFEELLRAVPEGEVKQKLLAIQSDFLKLKREVGLSG